MASIYDVNAAIQKPNMLAAVQQGYVFGTQQRQQREAEADRNMLRGLAPKIIEGDPTAYAQAAAIDPQAAQTYDNAGTNQLRKLKGFVDYVDRARASGNPQAVNAALRTGAPFLSQFLGGRPPPTEWTPDMDAGWEQLKAKVAMLGSDPQQEPAGYRQAHLTAIAAGYQPGTPEYQRAMQVAAGTAPRAIPPGYTTRSYRDANGQEVVELVQIRGEGAGQQMPAGGGAPAPQPAPSGNGDPKMDAIVKAANDMRAAGIPTAQIDAWMQQVSQNTPGVEVGAPQAMPNGGPAPMPAPQTLDRVPINSYGGGALPAGRGQTDADRARAAAEQAAMVEQARLRAQLSLAPQQAEADANREAAVTGARETAEAAAQRRAALPQVIAKTDQTLALINQALNHPGLATATGASGMLDPRNYLPGTAARDFQVLLDQLKGQTFLEAFQSLKGGGAITQVEGQKAEQAIARLNTAQSDEAFRAALTELASVAQAAKQRAMQNAGGAPQQPASQPGQYQPGQVIEANGRRFRVIGGDPNDPDVEEI